MEHNVKITEMYAAPEDICFEFLGFSCAEIAQLIVNDGVETVAALFRKGENENHE